MNYEFDWTPPATAVGNITIYVAGNAANASGNEQGDHIYTATYTLTPAAAGTAPSIDAGGVVSGASFQPGIVPGSWLTIKGSNLSPVTDTWEKAIVNGNLPTSLDGVSVSVGGKPAYRLLHQPGADQRAGARCGHRTGTRHGHHSQRHQCRLPQPRWSRRIRPSSSGRATRR